MKKNTWRFSAGVTALCAAILLLVPLFIANIKTKMADDGSYLTINTGITYVYGVHFVSDKELVA